jgi:ABC-type branched-subunit amino acid transport system ATPase component
MPERQVPEALLPADGASVPRHPLLEVNGVARSFGGVLAVSDLTFSVDEGTITALIGPNGAGKSTILALIAGAERVTSGTIRFDQRDITRLLGHRLAHLGIIRTFQRASVFGHLTVLENLVLGARPQSGERFWTAVARRRRWRDDDALLAEQAREVLTRFDLENLEELYAEELSGGQRRIIEILRAVMAKPRLLLLDEPMAGVHPTMRRRIEDLLLEVRAGGATMLMVEHELEVVERIADSVIVMTQGSVLCRGSMAELRENEEVQRAYLAG